MRRQTVKEMKLILIEMEKMKNTHKFYGARDVKQKERKNELEENKVIFD